MMTSFKSLPGPAGVEYWINPAQVLYVQSKKTNVNPPTTLIFFSDKHVVTVNGSVKNVLSVLKDPDP